ncbi:hypothetical protein NVIRENTERO_03669 [Sodalis praecaptivus]|nr:hypothetical protein NVIRENTERO_03669 [Sodalis praecaptivus]
MRSLFTDMLQGQLAAISDGTLNRRLYRAIRQGILEGVLRAGSRLPATRDLAQQLAISRNTAYDQLQAEGYISTRAGSGTFVTAHLPDGAMTTVKPPPHRRAAARAGVVGARCCTARAPHPISGAHLCPAYRTSPGFHTPCGDEFKRG